MTDLSPQHAAALHLVTTWMSEKYFRTFRPVEGDPGAFDALLQQRDRRVGVTVGSLWESDDALPGTDDLAAMPPEAVSGRRYTDAALALVDG